MLLTDEDLNLYPNLADINDLLEGEDVQKTTAEFKEDKKMLKDIKKREKKWKLLDLDDDYCGTSHDDDDEYEYEIPIKKNKLSIGQKVIPGTLKNYTIPKR